MSINMNSGNSSTQYSDFSHEQIHFSPTSNSSGDNVFGVIDVDPMSKRGGLDSDEVAEIVAIDLEVSALPEGLTQDPDKFVFRGGFGANLSAEDIPQNTPSGITEIDIDNISSTDDQLYGTGVAGGAYSNDVEGMFATWHIGCTGVSAVNKYQMYNMRELYGRGPVLDTTDDLGVVFGIVNEDANSADAAVECAVRANIVYDTATVEGTRTRFSLPEQVE